MGQKESSAVENYDLLLNECRNVRKAQTMYFGFAQLFQ